MLTFQHKENQDRRLEGMVLRAKIRKNQLGIGQRAAEVICVIDISGSMYKHFQSGLIQEIVERMLAIGLNFDPDKQIQIIAFGMRAHDCGTINQNNYHECVQQNDDGTVTINGNRLQLESGTRYAPAIDKAYGMAFGKDWKTLNVQRRFLRPDTTPTLNEPIANPFFTIFVTDGECSDGNKAQELVKHGSGLPLFTQFAGFGQSNFNTLDAIDNMRGRVVDNAGVFTADSLNITDEQLLDGMLNEFPDWLNKTANRGWY